jgi:sensor histidine kinase regulating citrate/malate metabolism
MERWFSKISLRWKLASVTVLATTVALLMTGVIMAVYDARTYETQKAGAITSAAEILAASVGAALIFNDSEAALEYLRALDANPEIAAAAVYDAENTLMTRYVRSGSEDDAVPQTVGAMESRFDGGELQVFVPVVQDDATVGAVYLKARVEPVGTRLARYTLILLAIGAGALAVILPISLWLHRLISNPIEELAARNAIIRATLDSVDHGVVVVGRDMKVAFLNEKVAHLSSCLCRKSPMAWTSRP